MKKIEDKFDIINAAIKGKIREVRRNESKDKNITVESLQIDLNYLDELRDAGITMAKLDETYYKELVALEKAIDAKLNGLDSLLSIVQMPPKVPVACVGIDRGDNAAYLAMEILAIKNEELAKKLAGFKDSMSKS